MTENLDRADTSLAGTALLSLNRVREAGGLSDFENEHLKSTVLYHLTSSDSGERTRIPAMQLLPKLDIGEGASEFLLSILNEWQSTVSEKAAALGALNKVNPDLAKLTQEKAIHSADPLLSIIANKILAESKL